MKNIIASTLALANILRSPVEDLGGSAAEPPVREGNVVDLEDAPDQGRVYLPQQIYTLVIVGATFGKSKSSGNNMITLEYEMVSPKFVRFKNEDIGVEGTSILEYVSLQPQALGKLKALHKTLKLPMKGVDLDNPDTNAYLGKALTAIVATKQKVMNIEGTNEPILDSETGKPVATNEYRIERYQSAAPDHNRQVAF